MNFYLKKNNVINQENFGISQPTSESNGKLLSSPPPIYESPEMAIFLKKYDKFLDKGRAAEYMYDYLKLFPEDTFLKNKEFTEFIIKKIISLLKTNLKDATFDIPKYLSDDQLYYLARYEYVKIMDYSNDIKNIFSNTSQKYEKLLDQKKWIQIIIDAFSKYELTFAEVNNLINKNLSEYDKKEDPKKKDPKDEENSGVMYALMIFIGFMVLKNI